MLLKEGADARGDERVAELRHAREEMMFNLKVQIRHPPADELERPRMDIHRVHSRITNPVDL